MRLLICLLLCLLFEQLWSGTSAASKDDVAWKILRERYQDQVAVHDAVPYSGTYHPEIFTAYRDRMPQIESLRRRFVELVLNSHRCDAIEQVGVDPDLKKGEELQFWLDCVDGTTFQAGQKQISNGQLPEPNRRGQWNENQAWVICETLLRGNGPSNIPLQIIDHRVETNARRPREQIVTLYFKRPKHGEKNPTTDTATCTFAPDEYPRISIGRNTQSAP